MKCRVRHCDDPEPLRLDIELLYERHVFCMSDDLLEMIHGNTDDDMPQPRQE